MHSKKLAPVPGMMTSSEFLSSVFMEKLSEPQTTASTPAICLWAFPVATTCQWYCSCTLLHECRATPDEHLLLDCNGTAKCMLISGTVQAGWATTKQNSIHEATLELHTWKFSGVTQLRNLCCESLRGCIMTFTHLQTCCWSVILPNLIKLRDLPSIAPAVWTSSG